MSSRKFVKYETAERDHKIFIDAELSPSSP